MDFVMPKLEWDESYSVKVGEFNDQHKLLFDYINDLRDSMMGKKGKDTVTKTLNNLLDYTNTHFFNEEIMLYKHEYPDYEKHKAAHDQFLSDIRGFYVRFHAGSADSRLISAEIIAVVTELLQEHILKADKAYAAFLNSKGVK
ncbi:MAG: hemerythrin family protein [Nitrospinae bacterium]|nr:hemerythrin family protein [Nitrospinota bacterium]